MYGIDQSDLRRSCKQSTPMSSFGKFRSITCSDGNREWGVETGEQPGVFVPSCFLWPIVNIYGLVNKIPWLHKTDFAVAVAPQIYAPSTLLSKNLIWCHNLFGIHKYKYDWIVEHRLRVPDERHQPWIRSASNLIGRAAYYYRFLPSICVVFVILVLFRTDFFYIHIGNVLFQLTKV